MSAADIKRFADRLSKATRQHGTSDLRIPLTALALTNMTLGTPEHLQTPALRTLTEPEHTLRRTAGLWGAVLQSVPYLGTRLRDLIDWIPTASEHEARALAASYTVILKSDYRQLFTDAHDLLGPVYTMLRSTQSRQASGAFYTPFDVASVIGSITTPSEGARVLEPCAGSGTMVLGAIAAMRSAGQDPNTCTWVLNDIDPIAIALAGINLASRGIHNVILTVGDGLALGDGTAEDPLRRALQARH